MRVEHVKGRGELKGLMAMIVHSIMKRSGGDEYMNYMNY